MIAPTDALRSRLRRSRRRGGYQLQSERLSGLIANVLQLARMERRELHLDLKPVRVASLLDLLRPTLASQIERSGFVARDALDTELARRELRVDTTALLQILINLVDADVLQRQPGAEFVVRLPVVG